MHGLKTVTDKTLRAWLDSGALDRSVGDALMFVASTAAARRGKASWILRYRHSGRQREKVLGRYPDLSLKDARELARKDRVLLRQGTDVAALKQEERLRALEARNVQQLGEQWMQRNI